VEAVNTSQDLSVTDYGAQGCEDDDMDDTDQPVMARINNGTWTEEDVEVDDLDHDGLVGLHEAICMSIEKCGPHLYVIFSLLVLFVEPLP